jgi:hypothetical protein
LAGVGVTIASVSETGATDGLAEAGADGDAATGAGCAAFGRVAIYAPAAAAVRHPAANTPARTLELMD